MSAKVTIKDNSAEETEKIEDIIDTALEAIGLAAEGHAAGICHVRTGRLRASISHATKETQGRDYHYRDDGGKEFEYQIGIGAKEKEVYIGTNVEYAPFVEKRYPFLRPAASGHEGEYKEILKKALSKG